MAAAELPTLDSLDPAAARVRRAVLLFLAAENPSEDGSDAAFDEIAADLETIHVQKGGVLCRQGEPSDRLFVVVSGRLRVILESPDGGHRVLSEIGRGETIGEMGLLTGEPRSATVLASRDCELVALPKVAFDRLIRRHPAVLLRFTRELVVRLRRSQRSDRSEDELLTMALVPLTPDVPIADLAAGLAAALGTMGRTAHLRARDAESRGDDLSSWLDEQEAAHQFVLYEAEPTLTAWTARCVRQVDRVVLVGLAGADPRPGAIEHHLAETESAATAARRELVLLHPTAAVWPRGTPAWLSARSAEAHHHVALDRPADVVQSSVDLCLHPPTDQFQLFDRQEITSVIELGYTYARPLIAEWLAAR